jgi:hypothetical protein
MSSNKYASNLIFVHETLLLDNGVPVHVVAARCGHDPAHCFGLMPRGPVGGRGHRQHFKGILGN